ncbi:MAG: Uma2 family endonuclease [Lewinellaceae bacterium]|nr:Uma2 family endonuclease [Phaeodactylibacter sp.]MCB9041928.1 Uma2 family endonuclease [Lewinellaceae bacterium]
MADTAIREKSRGGPGGAKKISWEAFQKKYLSREDNFKYEWVNGAIEKAPRTMDKSQFYIQDNLIEHLYQLKSNHSIEGQFIAEGDTFFAGNHRRPDMAFYTKKEIQQAADGETVVPAFVIEVISSKDQMMLVHKKMHDYREANVAVVWHIFPQLEEVHVYHGLKMEIRLDNDLCSAEPALPGFKISVNEVLKRG